MGEAEVRRGEVAAWVVGVLLSVLIEGVLRAAESVALVSVVVAGSLQAPFSVGLALSVGVLMSS